MKRRIEVGDHEVFTVEDVLGQIVLKHSDGIFESKTIMEVEDAYEMASMILQAAHDAEGVGDE